MAFNQSRDREGADPTLGFMSYRLVSACSRARLGWKTPYGRRAVMGSHGERFFSPWAFLEFTNPRQIGTANLPWLPNARGSDCLGRIGIIGRMLLPPELPRGKIAPEGV